MAPVIDTNRRSHYYSHIRGSGRGQEIEHSPLEVVLVVPPAAAGHGTALGREICAVVRDLVERDLGGATDEIAAADPVGAAGGPRNMGLIQRTGTSKRENRRIYQVLYRIM